MPRLTGTVVAGRAAWPKKSKPLSRTIIKSH